MWGERHRAWWKRRSGSARVRVSWWKQHWRQSGIRRWAIGRVWGFCVWRKHIRPSAWKQLPSAPCGHALTAPEAWSRFSGISSTGCRYQVIEPFHPYWSMTTSAAPVTSLFFSSPKGKKDAQPTNDREAAPHAPARHGGGIHTTTGRTANHATEFRGTLRTTGGPSVELAAEPGAGASAERCASAGSGLYGGHRLPRGTGSGQAGAAFADSGLGLGSPPPAYFSGGADRDRENVSGAGVRTEGVPRRVHRILRHCRPVVPGTGTGAGRWQLREEASDAGPGGCADRR